MEPKEDIIVPGAARQSAAQPAGLSSVVEIVNNVKTAGSGAGDARGFGDARAAAYNAGTRFHSDAFPQKVNHVPAIPC
jgi:hypothetical protein